jgi:hypothetical protein
LAIMLRSTPGVSRVRHGRFVVQVAAGAVLVLGLIALLVACAANSPDTENFGSTSSPLVVAGLFPTGVDATGTPLPIGATDPHYVLSSNDPLRPGPSALVVAPVTGWTANTPTSSWLSAQANASGTSPDNYTFTTTFTVAGVDPTTVTINGSWACDDSCVVSLNGTVVGSYAAPAWTAPAAFTIPAGSPFVLGKNTLAFTATNSGGGATGVQVTFISGTGAGCSADNQCSSAQFCNTQTGTCEGALPSGTPIPTIPGHAPPLDGLCTVAVGKAVCDAGVCDMMNNECGLANGDGPCTFSNGATLCQSGACSVNGTCEPNGGCNVDGDCTDAWCDETTHMCSPKLPNGSPLPSDPAHMNPTLDGTCSPGAATLVCLSELCSTTSNECVPCMATSCAGGAVCDASGVCLPILDGGSDASASTDATAPVDGSADASEGMDGSGDASETGDGAIEDARAKDAGRPATEGGSDVQKELRGDGLSCAMSPSDSTDPGGAPVWIFGVAAMAAFARKRRDRSTGDRAE